MMKALTQLYVEIKPKKLIKELEVDQINMLCGRIFDDGKIPNPNSLRDGYFSRKHKMQFVLDLLVGAFQN